MHTRLLGQTEIRVSPIGFGAWQLNNPLWGGPDEAASIRLVHAALDAGCNFFDTAPGYGEGASEQLLGQALRGRRDKTVLCTKYGHGGEVANFSSKNLRPALELSLQRLQTDNVDLLLLHNPPTDLLDGKKSATLYDELFALQREGKIRHFGASIDSSADLRMVTRSTASGAAEILYNAFHQEPHQAFAEAAERGVGLIAKVPLDSGWLSGKYDEHSCFDGIRTRWTPDVVVRRAELVRRFRAVLPPGLTLAQAALGFILASPEIATVIPGAKTLPQLRANLTAATAPLAPEIISAIRTLWETEIKNAPLPW